MYGLMMDRPLLIKSVMEFAAQFHSDTEIVSRSVEGPIHRYTYGDSYVRIKKLANALLALGVQPGDRVATLAWNTWRHFEVYYAVAGIGAICHTINPRLNAEQKRYIINHAEDKLLFFDVGFTDDVMELVDRIPSISGLIVMTDSSNMSGSCSGTLGCYEDLIAPSPETFDWPEFDENTASSMCYTSGTTGNPKGVLYSHRAIVLHTYAMCMSGSLPVTVKDTLLQVVPMFHVNAWGAPYAAPVAGAKLVLPGARMDGASLFKLMDDEEVTFTLGVPTVWMGLLSYMKEMGRKPRALRRVLVGGAAVSEAMIDEFELCYGVDVSHAWGMTETTPLGVVNTLKPKFENLPRDQKMAQKLKQGRVVFGVDMRIVDDDGRVLDNDGVTSGHLQVRGPWIIKEYYKGEQPALTEDGWFDTGDVATLDIDGYMHITDRAKDVIKSGGEWISSVILENAAMGHPDITHAAVIGIAHPKWQERPLLICVTDEDNRPTLDDINEYLISKVPKWWLPDCVEFVDKLPLGATGKVLKSELRKRFEEKKLSLTTISGKLSS